MKIFCDKSWTEMKKSSRCNFGNPHTFCGKKMLASLSPAELQTVSSKMFHYVCRYVNKPSGNIGWYDPTEIHNRYQLRSYMKHSLAKLGYHLILFFFFLYNMIVALLSWGTYNFWDILRQIVMWNFCLSHPRRKLLLWIFPYQMKKSTTSDSRFWLMFVVLQGLCTNQRSGS